MDRTWEEDAISRAGATVHDRIHRQYSYRYQSHILRGFRVLMGAFGDVYPAATFACYICVLFRIATNQLAWVDLEQQCSARLPAMLSVGLWRLWYLSALLKVGA